MDEGVKMITDSFCSSITSERIKKKTLNVAPSLGFSAVFFSGFQNFDKFCGDSRRKPPDGPLQRFAPRLKNVSANIREKKYLKFRSHLTSIECTVDC